MFVKGGKFMLLKNKFDIVGERVNKVEARQKVTGKLKFTGDLKFPGMLYCKILRSPYANAIVKKIDVSEALKLDGVVDVITYDDVPKILSMHQFLHVPEVMYYDSYLLEKHVRHVGDRVAAVAATSIEAAEEALKKIYVEYDILPAAISIEDALKPNAPQIHEEAKKGENPIDLKGNIFDTLDITIGDVDKGFANADYIIERTYTTSRPNNAPLERTAVICVPTFDERLDIYATSQGIHAMRMNISHSLGISASKLNCHRMFLGGSFGAHIHTGFIENICTFLALRTGKPVRGEKTREEMFLSCGRHPMIIKVKAGFAKDGKLLALHSDVTDNTGAYAFSGSSKMVLTAGFTLSMYKCPNLRITGRSVYTNTPPLTAMRGAGNPQAHWAIESMMDEASEILGIDPIELRRMNLLQVGDRFYGQGPQVISTIRSSGNDELLQKGKDIIKWDQKRQDHQPYPDKPWIRRGVGMARGFHTSGCGSEKPNKFIIDHSCATVKMNEDGTAQLINAAADLGGGVLSAHAAMVAEIIGLKYEDVIVVPGDTDIAPFDGPTHASRGLYGAGQPVVKCAEQVREILLEWAARIFQCGPEDVDIKQSKVFKIEDPANSIPLADIVLKGHASGWGCAVSTCSVRPKACPPHFIAIFVELEVNTLTGQVKVINVVSGADVGTVINPNSVEGQMTGGFHMGLGYAVIEDAIFDQNTGEPKNANFAGYHILTVKDMPDLDHINLVIANTFEPTGPLGAKGIGEGVTNPVAPAIANAIYNAVGVRIRDLPLNQEKLLAEIIRRQSV